MSDKMTCYNVRFQQAFARQGNVEVRYVSLIPYFLQHRFVSLKQS